MSITVHDDAPASTDHEFDVQKPTGPGTAPRVAVCTDATRATQALDRTQDDSSPLCGCNGW
jgi:hypothetical protein